MNTNITDPTAGLPNINSLWNYNEPAETEARFRAIIPEAEKAGNEPYYAELLTQVARAQGLQRKFDDAHKTLDTVEQMMAGKTWAVPQIRYLLERGRTYNSSNQKEKAISLFKEAYHVAIKSEEENYAADAAHMLGIAETPSEQLFWNLKTIELVEKSTNARIKGWLGPVYNNTAWAYHELKDYEKALELHEKSLAWRLEHKDAYGAYIAKWSVARVYRSLNRIDEALQIQNELLNEKEDGYVYEELGECLLLKNEKEEAKKYFKRAYELLSQDEWLKADEPARLERLNQLGK